jgi:hypothetical protein
MAENATPSRLEVYHLICALSPRAYRLVAGFVADLALRDNIRQATHANRRLAMRRRRAGRHDAKVALAVHSEQEGGA